MRGMGLVAALAASLGVPIRRKGTWQVEPTASVNRTGRTWSGGYPCNEDEWAWFSPTRYAADFRHWKGKKRLDRTSIVWISRAVDLSNLPVFDAYDVLPVVVQKVVKP